MKDETTLDQIKRTYEAATGNADSDHADFLFAIEHNVMPMVHLLERANSIIESSGCMGRAHWLADFKKFQKPPDSIEKLTPFDGDF